MFNSTCDRCSNQTDVITMSWFNTEMICKSCSDKELRHPLIKKAKEVERAELLKGNRNFEGIGLPDSLKVK